MPFDMEKLKVFYAKLLKIALMLTLVIGILLFVANMAGGGNPISYLGKQEFIMFIVFLILEWTGLLILTGRFQPPQMDGQPQRYQQPIPVGQPMQQVPAQIEVDDCIFCGEEKPIHQLREFRDDYGNAIFICEGCIKKEGGK